MKTAFLISVTYAVMGVMFAPGQYALVAFEFVLVSSLPLLVAALYEPQFDVNVHPVPGPLLFWGIFALGIMNLAIIAAGVDQSPAEILSTDGFVSIAAASTVKRYVDQGSSGNPFILALSLFLVYRLGAADTALSAWRKVLGFVPLVLYSLLTTEKWAMFLAGVFFLSGLFISRPYNKARGAALRYVTLFVVLGGGMAGLALVLRGFDGNLMELLMPLLHYILAPYSALGFWLIEEAAPQNWSFGTLTFIGPLNALGYVYREAGVWTGNFSIYGLETNIFTAWRYLVQDFSVFGPFLLNLSLTLLFIVFRRIRWDAASLAVSGFAIFCALQSLAVTPFVYNSTAFAMLLALAYSVITVHLSNLRLHPIAHEQT